MAFQSQSPISWQEVLDSHIDVDKIVNLTCRLVEKNTVNPPGNEYLVKEILIEHLKELGAKIEIYEPAPGRCNVLGYVGKGLPVVAVICHMDVVPPGEGWDFDPFSPQIKEGKIFGRGTIDNKGPYAASWMGIKALLEADLPFEGTIILGAVADEERGSRQGIEYLLKRGFSPNFCLIPDGGRLDKIIIGEKGRLEVKILTRGKSAHASEPEKGENAIYKMVNYLYTLRHTKLEGHCHELFTPPTVNLGEIRGGEAPNVVPDKCGATLDIRYPLGMKKDEILHQLSLLASKFDVEVKESDFSVEPHLVDEKSPIVKAFKTVARELGIDLKAGTVGGVTLAKNLYFRNIPSVVHSPSRSSVAHQANEYVEIENLVVCAKLWAGTIYHLLTLKEGFAK